MKPNIGFGNAKPTKTTTAPDELGNRYEYALTRCIKMEMLRIRDGLILFPLRSSWTTLHHLADVRVPSAQLRMVFRRECISMGTPMTLMDHSPEANMAILQEAFEQLNHVNIDGCLDLITPDFVINIAEMPYPKHGRTAWRQHAETLFAAIPDAKVCVEDIVASGDKVAVRVRVKGTHRGELLGQRPSGGKIDYLSHEIYRFEDGKIAEEWICSDSMTLMMQIGALSETRLLSMWLSGHRFWFGVAIGAGMALALRSMFTWLG